MAETFYTTMKSPIGTLTLVGTHRALERIDFPTSENREPIGEDWVRDEAPFAEAIRQLTEYFDGKRQSFDLPLDPAGTDFQQEVWQALLEIPYGETRSYGGLAGAIGRPKAVRAVGAANGRNPIPIVIPCHRVIGADGSLTGFGGGLEIKRRLLDLEMGSGLIGNLFDSTGGDEEKVTD